MKRPLNDLANLLHRPVESTADCSQSGAIIIIITASVNLANSRFLSNGF